jgi:hypothetical protein
MVAAVASTGNKPLSPPTGERWWSLILSPAIAFVVTVPVNRMLIARGRGHAVAHQFH